IKETLELYNYSVRVASDGIEGIKLFNESIPDLIILDIMMPRMDGFEVLNRIRSINRSLPVIILTAKSQTIDLVKGFELGCTDFIKKPFIIDELLVRVKAALSRLNLVNHQESDIVQIGTSILHISAQELRTPSQVFQLSFKETEILKRLWLNANRVIDRKSILLELWGDDNLFNSRNLNVYITKLRKYFTEDPNIELINIRSIGYKLVNKSY
ncbi:MAG TPA: response regulator transcription factor, partial [Chondromyces sp.]|nr:response regulator transcription factor [Chondromyces sp.]